MDTSGHVQTTEPTSATSIQVLISIHSGPLRVFQEQDIIVQIYDNFMGQAAFRVVMVVEVMSNNAPTRQLRNTGYRTRYAALKEPKSGP